MRAAPFNVGSRFKRDRTQEFNNLYRCNALRSFLEQIFKRKMLWFDDKNVFLRKKYNVMPTEKETILKSIKMLGTKVLPNGASLILFGSRARGDARDELDWDLLILLDEKDVNGDIFGTFAYPFVELGWEYGTYFSPKIYSYNEWAKRKGTPFYNNVSREGVVLC